MTRRSRGFTLLEVIIAMIIFSFISLFTAESIQRALQNRKKIQGELEVMGSLRDALKIMESDINKAFNYRDINIALYNETVKERNKRIQAAKAKGAQPAPPPNTPPPPPPKPGENPNQADPYASMDEQKPKTEKVLTQFIGETQALYFSSLSNARISSEDRTSDQAEIGYYLKSCHSRSNPKHTSNCLIRRVADLIDDDVTKDGVETNLLEDVSTLEFRYLGPLNPPDWTDTWYTNERGDDRSKGIFPYAVEITIETQNKDDKKSRPVRMTMVAGIRNPNNPLTKPAGAAAGTPGGPGATDGVQDPNPPPGGGG
jgi:prepilin-type N-terminal cleavage/methylation domain-containing protein